MSRDACRCGASAALIALIALTLAWELWLAPLRAGGSFLVFKALLLLFPLRGILAGRLYTYQWSSMFILAFFTEGVMRGWADHGLAQRLAWCEVLLSAVFFACVLGYARSFKRRA
ncbi:DUF2069 domain-containing protein [Chromobacterium alticapitis]|uniref:DUF2069 domain-containing protein n=1 Tax=Chromobacterium alticapitis TaxID=2073169 RepID=A0A2S5DLN4_9NEIS|nr:DUF2069 domain-containing protein [Chromobacterium alticapitis]POZ63975.1 DUF2069 domain-containing protein [Chromobacterium alticapitis]